MSTARVRDLLFEIRDLMLDREDYEDTSWTVEEALGGSSVATVEVLEAIQFDPEFKDFYERLDEAVREAYD